MMNQTKRFLAVFFIGCLLASGVSAQDKLPPSEILHLMFHEMAKNPEAQRTSITVPLMKRTQTEGLSKREQFALGEVYFTNLQPVESKAMFEPFMDGDDAHAAMAWERVMQILFRAEGKADEVEKMLPDFHKRFPPSPEIVYGAFFQIQNVAKTYQEKGDHERVVELVEAEVSQLSFDAPYRSWLLPATFLDSYEAVGKGMKARNYLRDAHAHYTKELSSNRVPAAEFVSEPGWQMLSITPSLPVFVLFVALVGLVMGARIFMGPAMHPQGATWSYAYLTMLVILAPAVMDGSGGDAAGIKFWQRLAMFGGTAAYAVIAVYVVDAFKPRKN